MEDNKKIVMRGNSVEIHNTNYYVYVDNENVEDLFKKMLPKGKKMLANITIEIEEIPERIQFEGVENIEEDESEEE
ncbi:MAG: hypothetical protein K0R54_2098 [Clostridiaceae bacterium]|jgi:hypothetical protein|nr:hypothetical protein [Clostridiaceae bacterium]